MTKAKMKNFEVILTAHACPCSICTIVFVEAENETKARAKALAEVSWEVDSVEEQLDEECAAVGRA